MSNRNTMMVISLIVLLGSVSFLNACNTTAGAGKDISKAGQAIEKSARQNTHY